MLADELLEDELQKPKFVLAGPAPPVLALALAAWVVPIHPPDDKLALLGVGRVLVQIVHDTLEELLGINEPPGGIWTRNLRCEVGTFFSRCHHCIDDPLSYRKQCTKGTNSHRVACSTNTLAGPTRRHHLINGQLRRCCLEHFRRIVAKLRQYFVEYVSIETVKSTRTFHTRPPSAASTSTSQNNTLWYPNCTRNPRLSAQPVIYVVHLCNIIALTSIQYSTTVPSSSN